jgi:tripartite-type tricarboxylate transporter receptor subunit TctC
MPRLYFYLYSIKLYDFKQDRSMPARAQALRPVTCLSTRETKKETDLNLNRRTALTATALALLGGSSSAWASDAWPTKPVRLVVPFPPGGAVDQVGRLLANVWSQSLGQQFIVDNKPGAVGAIGAGEVARAAPDGHTLLLALDSHAVNHLVNKNQPFDSFTSFGYLSLLVTLPQVIVVPASSPIKSMADLVARAKQAPLNFGTTGVASTAHQNVVRFLQSQNLSATHVPYRGAGPLATDVLGGHLAFASGGLSVMLPHIKGGSMRAIAVSTPKRSPLLPEVPAISETLPGHDVPSWIGLVAPTNLPAATRQKIIAAANTALKSPAVRQFLEEQAFNIVNSTPDEFLARARADAKSLQALIASKAVVLD